MSTPALPLAALLDEIDRRTLALFTIPLPVVGPAQRRCPACRRLWPGLDEHGRSRCCDATRTALLEFAAKPS